MCNYSILTLAQVRGFSINTIRTNSSRFNYESFARSIHCNTPIEDKVLMTIMFSELENRFIVNIDNNVYSIITSVRESFINSIMTTQGSGAILCLDIKSNNMILKYLARLEALNNNFKNRIVPVLMVKYLNKFFNCYNLTEERKRFSLENTKLFVK